MVTNNEFIIDTNEPKDVFTACKPVIPNLRIAPLNSDGYADYRWRTQDGKIKQVERKTWGELLSNTDKVEEQLHRHISKHPSVDLVFLLEGLVEQTPSGGSRTLHKQRNGYVTKGRDYRSSLSGIYAWLYEVEQYCQVIQTGSLAESSVALCAMYNHDQKDHHTTFKRHIKQLDFHPNPRVVTLMGISPGLGNVRASALIDKFITPWNVVTAGWYGEPALKSKNDLTVVHGIGKGLVDSVLRNFGRPDV